MSPKIMNNFRLRFTPSLATTGVFLRENGTLLGQAQSTKEQLFCLCNHLSILGGVIYNNPIKIDKVTTKPDFEMVLRYSYTIFICVGTTFTIYCLAVTMRVPRKTIKAQTIYLPSDISTAARYVYFVAVQTGRQSTAGTSSNICIRLYGDQNKSKSHVLNYPDPQKRILQRCNIDWFLVPTVHRLGELTEIALWSDFSGRNPSWFCTSVKIYDLQTGHFWYFEVNRWFSLPPKYHIYRKIRVSHDEIKKKRFAIVWRIFPKRAHQDYFTSFERYTILLSIFMTIFFTCVTFYDFPKLSLSDGFDETEKYRVSSGEIFSGLTSAIVTFVRHMSVTWILRSSDNGKNYMFGKRHYCWVMLIALLVLEMTVLIVLGFWVPPINSRLWLTSVAVAIFVYFFILENLYDLLSNLYKKEETIKLEHDYRKMLKLIAQQRKYLFAKFGENLLRPYFTHIYQGLDEEDIKKRRLKTESKKKLFALLEDTVMFACYVILLYLTIYANKNPMTVLNHLQMKTLLSGHHSRTESYASVESIENIYDYVNKTLIPTMHAQQWYSKYVVKEPGIMPDFHNKLLGVARLRQKRVVSYSCDGAICKSEFWYSDENYDHFGPEYNDLARLYHIWNYTEARFAGHSVYVGKFGIYQGGGFLAPLGRTWFNSYVNLMYLSNNSWLDFNTSVVMVEFLSYNVNTNLFSAVRIVFEKSSTGFLRADIELSTAQFLFVKNEEMIIQIVIFSSFVLVVGIFSLKFVSRLVKGRFLVLGDIWLLVDLLIVGLTYSCFVLHVYRAHSVKLFLDKVEKMKKNGFINYFDLLHEEESLTFGAALLVFVATVRLWKVCRFGTVFKIMERSVFLSMVPILVILFCHMIVIAAFTFWGCLIFGPISKDFRDVPDTLITLMLVMMGMHKHFDFNTFLHLYPILSRVYYTCYCLSNFLFLNIYVSVLVIYYYQAKIDISGLVEFYKVKHFVVKELLYYKTFLRMRLLRLKGGTLTKGHYFVTPKPDELHYAGCFTLSSNSIQLMSCIAIRVLRTKMSEDDEIKLMLRVLRYSRPSDKIDIFFSEKSEQARLIHENKIKRVAAAVVLILSGNEKSKKRREKKYKKVMAKQLKKFDSLQRKLNIILNVISNIEII